MCDQERGVRILLVGCSGFVGRGLVPLLLQHGHQLTLVSRSPQPLPALLHDQLTRLQANPADSASWQQPALQQALGAAEAVVNLAGEPIAEKRWTPTHLQLLQDSRILTTRALVQAMAALGRCLGRPSLLPVPGPLLQLLLGDGAKVVLEGQRVLPERLQQQGFVFRDGQLSAALAAATS